MTGRDSRREGADRYLFGSPMSRTVLVPGSVAAWLYDHGLAEIRQQCQGLHGELDGTLLAFAVVSDEFRHRGGSGSGTKPVPNAEPAPGLSEQVSVALAAERIGISERAVRKAATEGRLVGERVEGRWRIDAASVRAYRDNRAA